MSTPKIKVGVFGATGRMGQKNLVSVLADDALTLTTALIKPSNRLLGQDVGLFLKQEPRGVLFSENLESGFGQAQIVIDFSSPLATLANLELAIKNKVGMVIGTTGFTNQELETLKKAASQIPIVFSGNYSLGVNVMASLVRQASHLLKQFDIEIVEYHHHHKKDSPSGTALLLGRAAAEGRAQNLNEVAVFGREGMVGERKKNEIGIHAVRGGGVIGRHEVHLFSPLESLELTHVAMDRQAFTSGVILAVKWLVGQKPGLYDMSNVLGMG